jgi:hypothetical protein
MTEPCAGTPDQQPSRRAPSQDTPAVLAPPGSANRYRAWSYTHLLHRYAGLGDALFLNTIAFHLSGQVSSKILVCTNHPALLQGNPRIHRLPACSRKWGFRLARCLANLGIVSNLHYLEYGDALGPKTREPILAVLARRAGLNLVPERPCLFLDPGELRRLRLPQNGRPWIALQSAGQTDWTPNKEWYPARFETVATALRPRFRLVQLGLASDPKLPSDLDLRGQVSPRQAAAVLASCASFVGQVGFLMHAAAAVSVPAVIVYGGFEAPWQSGYPWNENLFTPLECSPCWLSSPCPYARRCMNEIQPKDVLAAFDRLWQKNNALKSERSLEKQIECE